MALKKSKMNCPNCGDEMNHHADKLVHPATSEEAKKIDPAIGGIIEEMHCCPGCGIVESRRDG